MNLRLYEVDNDYVGELYRRDSKVEYHHGQHDRPYLGIVLDINKTKYFVLFHHLRPSMSEWKIITRLLN